MGRNAEHNGADNSENLVAVVATTAQLKDDGDGRISLPSDSALHFSDLSHPLYPTPDEVKTAMAPVLAVDVCSLFDQSMTSSLTWDESASIASSSDWDSYNSGVVRQQQRASTPALYHDDQYYRRRDYDHRNSCPHYTDSTPPHAPPHVPPHAPPHASPRRRGRGVPPRHHNYDNSSGPGTVHLISPHYRQKPKPRPTGHVRIEISTGVTAPLWGSEETFLAMEEGHMSNTMCICCRIRLECIQYAAYVICPDCRVVSPILNEEDETIAANSNCNAQQERYGVGLGVKKQDSRNQPQYYLSSSLREDRSYYPSINNIDVVSDATNPHLPEPL